MPQQVSLNEFYRKISGSNLANGASKGGPDPKYKLSQNYFFYVDFALEVPTGGALKLPLGSVGAALQNGDSASEVFGFGSNRSTGSDYFFPQQTGFSINIDTDIRLLAQSVEMPNFQLDYNDVEYEGGDAGNYVYVNDHKIVETSNNTIQIEFLSTEFSLHEHLFLQWMREAASSTWLYPTFPFPKARINVYFLDQENQRQTFAYTLREAFPVIVDTLDGDHKFNLTESRNVTFAFNWASADLRKPDAEIASIEQSRRQRLLEKAKTDEKNNGLPKTFPEMKKFASENLPGASND